MALSPYRYRKPSAIDKNARGHSIVQDDGLSSRCVLSRR